MENKPAGGIESKCGLRQTQKVNYQILMDRILDDLETSAAGHAFESAGQSSGRLSGQMPEKPQTESPAQWPEEPLTQRTAQPPTLLLHACCAPCSSYVLEYLAEFFRITVFFYNPNIEPAEEYRARAEELKRLIRELPVRNPVAYLDGTYEPERFRELANGLEDAPEGGARCAKCFRLRLWETAETADRLQMDYFATTLTISPLKDAQRINQIGMSVAEKHRARWLPSDFKKRGGYQRSIELSREYDLYRQNFCGCIYSREALI